MKVIYADSLFALSLFTDYLLCLVTARFCGLRLRRGRYLLAALLGSVYAVAVFLPGMGFLASPLVQTAAAGGMGLVAFGGEERLLRCVAAFLALSATFGGVVWAVTLRLGSFPAPDGKLLLAVFVLCYAALSLFSRGRRARTQTRVVPASLALGERRAELRVLLDSGNCLREETHGARVLIASPESVRALLGEGFALADDAVALTAYSAADPLLRARVRPIRCDSLGGPALLPLLRADFAEVDGKRLPDAYVALSRRAKGEGFEGIY